MYYNQYKWEHIIDTITMLKTTNKRDNIKRVLKWAFGGFTIFFIAILVFMTTHDAFIGNSSQVEEYCAKYGLLASPEC